MVVYINNKKPVKKKKNVETKKTLAISSYYAFNIFSL